MTACEVSQCEYACGVECMRFQRKNLSRIRCMAEDQSTPACGRTCECRLAFALQVARRCHVAHDAAHPIADRGQLRAAPLVPPWALVRNTSTPPMTASAALYSIAASMCSAWKVPYGVKLKWLATVQPAASELLTGIDFVTKCMPNTIRCPARRNKQD